MAGSSRFAWFQSRSPRERVMLAALGVVIVGALIWLAVLRPLWGARAESEARLNAAVSELAQLRATARARTQAGSTGTAPPTPIDTYVTAAAAEAGFANAAVAAETPTRATLAIPAARPAALLGWLGQLEERGILVDAITLRANPDQSVAVQARLKARGN